jgi:hypothetical protein
VQPAALGLREAGHWPSEVAEDNEGFGFERGRDRFIDPG